ncbi:flavin-containing monooxygenase [Streptomyces sp. NPDC057580]|uniref:flavin-containing monooxygenase n=1 Tax=Streptomyces sp. NPDC057580 TaxID=3346173 RepID=UPI003689562F
MTSTDAIFGTYNATQPEIRRYAEHVAERHGLGMVFRFGRRVSAARYDADASVWTVRTTGGEEYRARYVFLATGCLSVPKLPEIPGLDDFAGDVLLTAQWPEGGTDLAGRRVGVIGTGSSGIQSIPLLAEVAEHLTVFQRSANYSVPVHNRDLSEEALAEQRRSYPERRALSWASGAGTPHTAHPREIWELDETEREAVFEDRWREGGVLFGKTFPNQTTDPAVNKLAREFAEAKIRSIVRDPRTAEDLIPVDHPIGTKRICTDGGYYETFNRDNVTLVNLRRDPITTVTPRGIRTEQAEYELDTLVLATGFDAMTGAVTRIDIQGPRGDRLADTWANGPVTYLGMGVPGFPNLFILTGPGSPSVLVNMVMAAEQQVDWLVDLVTHCIRDGRTSVEARPDAAQAWTEHVDATVGGTLFPQANSWYLGANVPGKPRVFMPYIGGFKDYLDRCDDIRDRGYAGFVLSTG